MTRSAPALAGGGQRQVHRAGLLRVGERHGRERRVGLGLLRARRRASAKPGPRQRRDDRRPPTPCSGVSTTSRSRGPPGQDRRRRRRRGRPRRSPSSSVVQPSGRHRDVERRADGARSAAAISASAGRHDLRAVAGAAVRAAAEVDLVAVVLRRVVARGDHDAGVRAEVPDGEGEHRGRQRAGQDGDRDARRGDHGGGVAGEHVGVVPRVVARRRACGVPGTWSRRHAARPAAARITTARFIRFGPAPSSPRRPAVPNCSEPANRSASSSLRLRRSDRASGRAPPAGSRRPRRPRPGRPARSSSARRAGVGVVVAPRGGLRPAGRPARRRPRVRCDMSLRPGCRRDPSTIPRLVRSVGRPARASPRPVRGGRPAARTSAWSSGSREMPAARLVTREMPSTSRPACRAAMASSAVDMPTRCPPRIARHPHLGGRLVLRAAELHVDALGEAGSTSRHSARSRGEYRSVRSTNVGALERRGAGEVDVVADQHRRARARHAGSRPPQPLVSTSTRQPAAAAVRTPCTTAPHAAALVEVGAAPKTRARRRCRRSGPSGSVPRGRRPRRRGSRAAR